MTVGFGGAGAVLTGGGVDETVGVETAAVVVGMGGGGGARLVTVGAAASALASALVAPGAGAR